MIVASLLVVGLVACSSNSDDTKEATSLGSGAKQSASTVVESKNNKQQAKEWAAMVEAKGNSLFASVLKQYKQAAKDGDDEKLVEERLDLSTGFSEMSSEKNIAKKIGYEFMDLNQDGTEELIITRIGNKEIEQNYIIAIYMYGNNGPKRVSEGWSRNAYYVIDNGQLLNEGSGGAMDNSFTKKRVRYEGEEVLSELSMSSYVEGQKVMYAYNPNGETKNSKKYKVSKKKFNSILKTWEGNRMKFDATPISEFVVK